MVSNAVEHTDRARGIVVRLQMEVYEGQEYLTATVRDFGKGFSEQDLIYADQEFYSGDASRHDRTHQGLVLRSQKFLKEQGACFVFTTTRSLERKWCAGSKRKRRNFRIVNKRAI